MAAQLSLGDVHLRATTDKQCQGRDPLFDPYCRCPELAVEITFDLVNGHSKRFRYVCSCCYQPFPAADRRNPAPPKDVDPSGR